MDGTMLVSLAVAILALVTCALLALLFWRGKCLILVLGRTESPEYTQVGEAENLLSGNQRLARRMAVVLLIGCFLIATLIGYEVAKLAGNASLASVLTLLNNVSFLAFIAGVIWFFIAQRSNKDENDPKKSEPSVAARARVARLDHLPTATILFVIAYLIVIGLVGVLFAL